MGRSPTPKYGCIRDSRSEIFKAERSGNLLCMILVYILLILIAIGATKHPKRRRRRSRVRPLRVSEQLALGAQTSESVVKGNFDDSVSEKTFLLSLEANWSYSEHTPDQGSITVGIAHSDYTAAEILEWYDATSAWDTGNLVAQEQNRRKIRQVGVFSGALAQGDLNDGKSIKTPLKFIVETGATLQIWAISHDTSTLTSGTVINVDGKVWAVAA